MAEHTWLGGSVSDINDSGKTAVPVAAQTWLTGPGGSGNREAAATSKEKQKKRSKLHMEATEGRRQGDSEIAVTETLETQI